MVLVIVEWVEVCAMKGLMEWEARWMAQGILRKGLRRNSGLLPGGARCNTIETW
jgi:hypothetical protein